MWLCTRSGFYSIVRKTAREIHVRARCRRDLENLVRLVGVPARSWTIHRTAPADYRFRIVLTHPFDLGRVMDALTADLKYSNFKSAVADTPDQCDKLGIYTAFHHDLENWQEANAT